MKKSYILLMCLLAILAARTSLKAQEITITLSPGWNWISYPNGVPMEKEEALGSFVPVEGDIINSQTGSSVYNRGRWTGTFTHFMPGFGYMYYSARSEVTSFVFANASSTVVETATPTDITTTSAVVGGTVTVPEGGHVFLRGVCWGTEPNPDIDGDHTAEGTGMGSFSSTLEGLNPNTTYYIRAYAVSDHGLVYGNEQSITVGDYAYVDLGLPSGLLWATCNVGANTPEEYGDYFAWGETQPKDTYEWSTYQHGSASALTKYCNDAIYGYNGFTDNLTILLPEDDAATANWGSGWRMPTKEEWQELYNNTIVTWTSQNGVNGRLFTAANGNSFFLPAAGFLGPSDLYAAGFLGTSDLYDAGSCGYYWSSSLYTDYPDLAWELYLAHDYYGNSSGSYRSYGLSVRPVCSVSQNTSFSIDATASPSEGGTVSGGGTYQQGQSCTVHATANSGYTFTNWTEGGIPVSTNASYTFTVTGNRTLVANFTYNGGGDHAYVDLGLPSGTLWATCNVGADSPEDYGDYFAWGETQPKSDYSWGTYQYCMGNFNTLTKYCNNAGYGYNGFTDNLTTLQPSDDAATANWGTDWRMPTNEEWQELYNNTTHVWTTQNGVNGRLFTASNGNSLFLPASGYRNDGSLNYAGSNGYYWSSSLSTGMPDGARIFYFNSGNYIMSSYSRHIGQGVRPVRSISQN